MADDERRGRVVFEDGFEEDWAARGRRARWRVRPLPWLPGGDGRVETTAGGLSVVSGAVAPESGLPAFGEVPEGQEGAAHLRWAAFAHPEPGARAPELGAHDPELGAGDGDDTGGAVSDTGVLRAETVLSAEILGADRHPEGDGPRCAMAAMICVDLESGMVFDFALTNNAVWVLYERLPRPGARHGTFAYAVPVAGRTPDAWHRLTVEVSASTGWTWWLLDGVEVFAVPAIGLRLPSQRYLERSTPGPEERVAPRGLTLGLGLLAETTYGQGARLRARSATLSVHDLLQGAPAAPGR